MTTLLRISMLLLLVALVPVDINAKESFSHLWSGYATSLSGRSPQQRSNAILAGRYIDGHIIPPNGVFSFNELVGGRSHAKGFEAAPFINGDGLLEDAPGGGVCQLASTIYNAGLLGGLEVVERHPHSRTVLHVPPGRDATIASWRKDLKFKNPFQYPLLIRIGSDNNRLTVALRAPAEKPFSVEVFSEQVALEAQTVVGQTIKGQKGGRGFSTTTWRVLKKNGVAKKELLSEDVYPAPSRILAGGGE